MTRKRHARKQHTTPPAPPGPKTFTISELAKRWRVCRHTITGAIKAGRLQAFKVGDRQYRVSEIEVLRYEQQAFGGAA